MTAMLAPSVPATRSTVPKTTGRIVGGLFLSAFLLYGGGTFLIDSTTGSSAAIPENAASLWQLSLGAALLLLNSAAVFMIGVLAFRVLRDDHRRVAVTYLAARTVEAVLLALAPVGTLTLVLFGSGDSQTPNDTSSEGFELAQTLVDSAAVAYSLAMATLGVASIFFCRVLLKSGLLPRFLAWWGIAGYAIFALGSVLELSGYAVGLMASIPGGLFEAAAGSYLLAKGFRNITPDRAAPTHDTGPTTTTPTRSTTNAAYRTQPSDAR